MEPQVGTPRRRLPAGHLANQSPGQLARTRALAPTPAGLKYDDDRDCAGPSIQVDPQRYLYKIFICLY